MEVIIYNIASIIGIFSFLLTNILWIRIVFTISTCLFVVAGLLFQIYSIAVWNLFYTLINLTQIIIILKSKRPIKIPEPFTAVYKEIFPIFTTREFMSFIKLGVIKTAKDTYLCHEGDYVNKLFLLLQGQVSVIKNKNEKVTTLHSGQFIGEMRFISKKSMSASMKAMGSIQYIIWEYDKIKQVRKKNPQLYTKFLYVLGEELSKKFKLHQVENLGYG